VTKRLERAETILRALVHEIRTERITFMAGTIAYNAFLSLLPLLFVLLTIVSAVGGSELEADLISMTETLVTPGAAEIFVAELRHSSVGASFVGIAALLWGMSRIFRSLDIAFSDIYETHVENTLSNHIRDSLVAFSSLAALLVGVFAFQSVFGISAASGPLLVAQRVVLVGVIALALAPMYYLFPDESGMSVPEILPGLLFTSTALVVLQSIVGYYVTLTDPAANNQLLASIVVLLTWLYFCGLVVLLGAAINAVLTNRSEDVNIDPVIGGVPREKVGELGVSRDDVSRDLFERLQHSLDDGQQLRVVVDSHDGESVELPSPDIVSVDADTSSLPVVSDTASIELQWSEASLESEPQN